MLAPVRGHGWWLGALLACVACDGGEVILAVQVRTDLRPGRDFTAVLVTQGATRLYTDAADHRAWGEGVRVAELTGLEPGRLALEVAALGPDGEAVVARRVGVELRGGVEVVTVLLTRSCGGVVCPAAGDLPEQTACAAGRCVEEDCVGERAEACGPPECASDTDCGAGGACTADRCVGGLCFRSPDHDACAPSELCDVVAGCVPIEPGALSPRGTGHALLGLAWGAEGGAILRVDLASERVEELSAFAYAALGMDAATPAFVAGASASPSGRWVVFVGRDYGLYRVDVDGVEPVLRIPPEPTFFDYHGSAIADDGHTIVALDSLPDGWGLVVLTESAGAFAVSATLDRPLPYSHSPRWRGDEVVFACSDDPYFGAGVCAADLAGAAARMLHPPPSEPSTFVSGPAVEPTGDVLVGSEAPGAGGTDILRIPAEGGTATVLASSGPAVGPCALSDGRWLVLASAAPPLRLRVMRADGVMERELALDDAVRPGATVAHLAGCSP